MCFGQKKQILKQKCRNTVGLMGPPEITSLKILNLARRLKMSTKITFTAEQGSD